ncbi:MAG TPA: hypothetical protein VGD67_08260 [Pseudonocardiaceae bacterium]
MTIDDPDQLLTGRVLDLATMLLDHTTTENPQLQREALHHLWRTTRPLDDRPTHKTHGGSSRGSRVGVYLRRSIHTLQRRGLIHTTGATADAWTTVVITNRDALHALTQASTTASPLTALTPAFSAQHRPARPLPQRHQGPAVPTFVEPAANHEHHQEPDLPQEEAS